jgi:hypothetical protein
MSSNWQRRLAVWVAFAMGLCPLTVLLAETPQPLEVKTRHVTGRVVPLAEELARSGVRMDADAAPNQLALVTDQGSVYPLIKDAGSRMFYKDKRLLNRPMRLTGRIIGGGSLLQVTQVHSVSRGQLREVYYWCDVCTIKRFEKMDCECCGGPMDLREEPIKP